MKWGKEFAALNPEEQAKQIAGMTVWFKRGLWMFFGALVMVFLTGYIQTWLDPVGAKRNAAAWHAEAEASRQQRKAVENTKALQQAINEANGK